ncbi:hypothetical protein TNCV_1050811 [Trichonephila clavipes]|nr:hypothetical protein TNCV_1050811 [Trichonephila clavipes]
MIHLASNTRVDQPAVFIPMTRPLSNSLNCEKCLLSRLPGMFRLPKSSYNRRAEAFVDVPVGSAVFGSSDEVGVVHRNAICVRVFPILLNAANGQFDGYRLATVVKNVAMDEKNKRRHVSFENSE